MIKRDKLMNDYESRHHKQRVSQSLVFNIIHVTIILKMLVVKSTYCHIVQLLMLQLRLKAAVEEPTDRQPCCGGRAWLVGEERG